MISIVIDKQLSTDRLEYLKSNFFRLFKQSSYELNPVPLYKEIVDHYEEEHRSYHNMSHIWSMLQLADQLEEQILEPTLLRLAIWYHDIIYVSTRKDNELKSAEFAEKRLKTAIGPAMTTALKQLINSTAKHIPLLDFEDNKLLLDLDLAVLATDRDIYDQYRQSIREEYRVFPTILYRPGRKKVLKHFLERERIYYTDTFLTNYERKARENLKWELDQL